MRKNDKRLSKENIRTVANVFFHEFCHFLIGNPEKESRNANEASFYFQRSMTPLCLCIKQQLFYAYGEAKYLIQRKDANGTQ